MKGAAQYMATEDDSDSSDDNNAFYTDRRYHRNDRGGKYHQKQKPDRQWKRKCWVCKKEGCWSTKHPERERKEAKDSWKAKRVDRRANYSAFLAEYEGIEPTSEPEEEEDTAEHSDQSDNGQYLTAAYLSNQSFQHRINPSPLIIKDKVPDTIFVLDRYTRSVFQGIMPDIGAARVSIAGKE